MCGFQNKFDVRVIPSRFTVSHGVIVELSKKIGELRGVLERDEKKLSFRSIKFAPLDYICPTGKFCPNPNLKRWL